MLAQADLRLREALIAREAEATLAEPSPRDTLWVFHILSAMRSTGLGLIGASPEFDTCGSTTGSPGWK